MTLAHKWKHDRSDRSDDLIFGIVISILLHLIVYLGYDNWLRFKPQQKRSPQPIPIEFIEVPPNPKQTPPPQTKRIATNNSVAGGKSLPEKPVAVRSTPPVVGEGDRREQGEQGEQGKQGNKLDPIPQVERRAPLIAKLKSQTTRIAPSIPQPQPKPQTTRIAPSIPQPQPKPQTTRIAPSIPQPEPKPLPRALAKLNEVIAPSTPQPQPKPQTTVIAPSTPQPKRLTREDLLQPKSSSQLTTRTNRRISQPQPKPQTTVIAPSIPPRKPLARQVLPPKSSSSQLATRTTSKIPSQTKGTRTSGAASRLGGSMSVSSRNFQGNYQAALPNSNRFNQSADGIDARRDVDMGSYLTQLQQRVRQQWIPGQTQSSRKTVVHFVVSRSGQVRGLAIARASGSSVTDSAALGAISRAAPFAPLPVGYPHNSINIRFTFNINVSGQLELGVR